MVDALGVTLYGRDSLGRLASVVNPTGETIHYCRDANGNLLSLASPAAVMSYAYDAAGRLTQVNGPEGQAQSFYDLVGNRLRLIGANGITSDAIYDLRNRPTLVTYRAPNTSLVGSFANVFSLSGRRTQVTELDGSQIQYAYDAKGRLLSEMRAGVAPLVVTYAYDAVGNRTQAVRNGVPTNYAYDTDDRLLSDGTSTYAWDANGNLLSKTTGPFSTLYAWDPQNRLVSVTDPGGATQYAYDADGNRVRTTTATGTTRFLVDGANNTGLTQVLEERDGGGVLQARYSYGSELLSMGRGGLQSYFHFDAQGSTRVLTNAAGTPTDTYAFDAGGRSVNTTGTTANAYLYGGQRLDAGAGLYHLRARTYDPQLGRFLSRDPLEGSPEAPSTLHRYLYAGSDPVNFRDPSGLDFTLFGLTISANLSNAIDAASAFKNLTAACKAKEKLYEVQDLAFYVTTAAQLAAVAGNVAVVANGFLSGSSAQKDLFDDPGKLNINYGNKLTTDTQIFAFTRGNPRAGSIKKIALFGTSGGGSGGLKFSLEVAAGEGQAGVFELELPSFKTSAGFTKEIFPQYYGCPAIGKIYGEFNGKGNTDFTTRTGAGGGLDLKLDILNGALVGTLPLLSGEVSFSKTGFRFQVTIGGFVQTTFGE